jgi:hypothetical protein
MLTKPSDGIEACSYLAAAYMEYEGVLISP